MRLFKMKLLFDFSCPECSYITEKLVDTNIRSIKCECGNNATRIMSTPTVKLEGITGSFPDAHDKWARIREDNARIKGKRSYAEE
jgi:hypothetical protein